MKITFILPEYPTRPSGGFKVIFIYASGLARIGHEVTIVYPRYLKGSTRKFILARRIISYFSNPVVNWFQLDHRVKIYCVPEPLEKFVPDADAVLATYWGIAEYVKNYSKLKGEKFYLIQDYEIWGGMQEKVDNIWRSDLWKIIISKWLLDLSIKLGVPEKKSLYLPHVVDSAIYYLVTPIDMRGPCIAMMYSKLNHKGAEVGISALKIIKKDYPQLKCLIFGSYFRPLSLPRWMQYFHNLPVDQIVRRVYNMSSIFLCSSHKEGWFLPATEAMACGCALVSTDHGGTGDYATHNVNALLSPPGDHFRLAENARYLLKNDDFRKKLAMKGHDMFRGASWDNNVILLEQFIMKKINN